MSPVDGTLWVSGFSNGLVEHITTAGTVLGSFPIGLSGGFSGIGMAPDGNSLYVGTSGSGLVRHFDLSGNQLDQFNTGNSGISHMVVVPGAVPEPSTWASLAFGATALLARRRRGIV